MDRRVLVGWRWLRRRCYRVSRWPEQAVGDNHPAWPRVSVSTTLVLVLMKVLHR